VTDLADRLLARERDAVPEALNLLDDRRPESRRRAAALLAKLEAAGGGRARRIGLTGAPGVGKSTLLDALLRRIRARGETVGVIAVDPSSARSGGALLGDRVRVRASAGDAGVFFRSTAARERLGGLAEGTRAAVTVLAAVFDVVVVETVGVGQSEGDVAHLVDSLVYVAQPGAGDLLQFMKAGVLELPDLFLVNKADLGAEATRTRSELEAGVALGERDPVWVPPVVLVSARDGTGLDELESELARHMEALEASGALAARRRAGRDAFVLECLQQRYGSHGTDILGGACAIRKRLDAQADASGFALADALAREIQEGLSKKLAGADAT